MNTALIGIDPGVETGFALITSDGVCKTESLQIHQAMALIEDLMMSYDKVLIRVEDARKRKWFGKNAKEKQQGAGSIKRDCSIWEDFLTEIQSLSENQLTFEMVHPVKGATKLSANFFRKLTGIQQRTNEHSRDAFMLIYGYSPNQNKIALA